MGPQAADVAEIESELERQRPGRWYRLFAGRHPRGISAAGWAVKFANGELQCGPVTEIEVHLDPQYPYSQPLVYAKQAFDEFSWPHVESDGMLCLSASRPGAPAADRVMQHLSWACEVLQFTDADRRQSFEREFGSYWAQRSAAGAGAVVSLLQPEGPTRRISAWCRNDAKLIVVAEYRDDLAKWLENSGEKANKGTFQSSWLTWLPQPWLPTEFADRASALFGNIPDGDVREIVEGRSRIPLIIGVQTCTGPVLGCIAIDASDVQRIQRSEIRTRPVPLHKLRTAIANGRTVLLKVNRADAAWVHGRGHNQLSARLSDMSATVVGCGAIGGNLARLLVQSGVGSLVLVDPEEFVFANTSRHVLGSGAVGGMKATALATSLLRDFPHIRSVESFSKSFQTLSAIELGRISRTNLLISAGVPYDADAALDVWRRQAAPGLPHLCVWAEEYALAGHAVVRFDGDSLLELFDDSGEPCLSATEWPADVAPTIVEAGCGNGFQPYTAIDLQPIISMGARMALGVLLGDVTNSRHRLWLGDRARVASLRGRPSGWFDRDFAEREI